MLFEEASCVSGSTSLCRAFVLDRVEAFVQLAAVKGNAGLRA